MLEVFGIGGFVLAVAGIVLTVVSQRLQRPHLEIRPAPFQPEGPVPWTFAAVRVHNNPAMPRPFAYFLTREAAVACEVSLEFRKLQDPSTALPAIQGRWSSQPEPLRREPVTIPYGDPITTALTSVSSSAAVTGYLGFRDSFDLSQAITARRRDVSASEAGEEVAVAILKADGTAYAWGEQSYAHPGWENPDWKLERGTVYEVAVTVHGSGVRATRTFRLRFLSGDFSQFTVEPVT